MDKWNAVSRPPKEALKKITGGRLKGMSDINPQWRTKVMTETYGLCGIGWKYEIVKKWSDAGSNDELFAFVDINLFIKVDGEWSDAIPGHGGNMLVSKEKYGLYNNDEAYKMALTDALSVAMKSIGVASEVYEGVFDSKYSTPAPVQNTTPKKVAMMTMEQGVSIKKYRVLAGLMGEDALKLINIKDAKKVTKIKADTLIAKLRILAKEKQAKDKANAEDVAKKFDDSEVKEKE